MIPNDAWEHNNNPVQRAKEKTLNCVPIFMNAKLVGSLLIEEYKDTQRQTSTLSR